MHVTATILYRRAIRLTYCICATTVRLVSMKNIIHTCSECHSWLMRAAARSLGNEGATRGLLNASFIHSLTWLRLAIARRQRYFVSHLTSLPMEVVIQSRVGCLNGKRRGCRAAATRPSPAVFLAMFQQMRAFEFTPAPFISQGYCTRYGDRVARTATASPI